MPKALKPPPHVRNKPAWIQRAASDILRTGFNKAFLFEEIGDVIAKHASKAGRIVWAKPSELRAIKRLEAIQIGPEKWLPTDRKYCLTRVG